MNREEFQTERTRIISEMLDNPDEYGIYPTTKCFEQLDALFDSLSLPPAEGAEQRMRVRNILQDFYRRGEYELEQAEEDIMRLFQPHQPTAEGAETITAEEFIREKIRQKLEIKGEMKGLWTYGCNGEDALRWAHDFATLHAQRIAEKMVKDMRQKLFSMRSSKEAMDKLSEADRLMMYGYHDCINEMLMWTKPREI